jgi:hypothetical protein
MTQTIYRIKSSFLIPLGLDVVLLLVLLGWSVLGSGTYTERVVLGVFFLLALAVFAEAVSRNVSADGEGISIRKFFRGTRLLWPEINYAGTLIMRGKAYILLTTTKGYHVLSSAYGNYEKLVDHMVRHLDAEKGGGDASSADRPAGSRQVGCGVGMVRSGCDPRYSYPETDEDLTLPTEKAPRP